MTLTNSQRDLIDRETSVWNILPGEIQGALRRMQKEVLNRVEELRLRVGQPLQVLGMDLDAYLSATSGVSNEENEAMTVTLDMIAKTMQKATQASLYAVEEDLRRGYVTVQGGHRIGVAGRVALFEGGGIKSIRNISSINIRVAREWPGAATEVARHMMSRAEAKPLSTLILSPPGCGKTTMLRDLARQWSEGVVKGQTSGKKVTIVDERSEIAGSVEGIPQFRIGPRTDILDGCPKADGMLMAIRSLSPDILVTDEIGRQSDVDAILEALHAGVAVIASAHANSLAQWKKRPHMDQLYASGSFRRYVLLSRRRGPCTVESVLDQEGLPVARLS